ncbi:family 4 polysaccharide lyase [Xylariales sp. PMI_506]|nr:family 4 polysaccharide lyase [Xylariales sp. PMI_506]
MKSSTLATGILASAVACVSAITVKSSDGFYVVDTESSDSMTVSINSTSCDITSLQFQGTEYQSSSSSSQIASGLESANVSYTTSGDYVIFQCVASNEDFNLTHYMVFEDATDLIYFGTHTTTEPEVGELRMLIRLVNLPDTYPWPIVSDIANGTAIEAEDGFLVGNQTRSKFFSSDRFIDDLVYCAYNDDSSVHACFIRPNNQATEKSSGGPFFRDIDLNLVTDGYQSLTYYMNSEHVQTEAYRQGFHGPYVFAFTTTEIPSASDYNVSFFDDLGLDGYIGASGRGYVSGTASGTSSNFSTVLHWYNDDYQNWVYADNATGEFTSPAMVAGEYTMNLYQQELLAASVNVTVKAGATTTADIAATNTILTDTKRTTVFQLGDYDGQPAGFLNADKQQRMHPSDLRMSDWNVTVVDAGDDDATAAWPMVLFMDYNDGASIEFSLDAAISATATLRLATTLAFAGGRPQATVNSYVCDAPSAPVDIDSRGVTRGAYRGNGEVYECSIPTGNLVAGTNNVTINIVSGSSGTAFLSPNVIFDAIELFY